ncbi:MAG: outer membrane protein assembly factor BamD (BamD/ComL family) [Chlamydiales bacterium]|jgi:outer membrane protein assembly factor BamD (BamD/ComL family)
MLPETAPIRSRKRERLATGPLLRLCVLLPVLMMGAACAGSTKKVEPLGPGELQGAIASARADLAEGRSEDALERMRKAVVTPGLSTDERGEAQDLLERACLQRIKDLSDPPKPAKLRMMLKMELPRQLAVQAGITGARLHVEADDRSKAFSLIEDMDLLYPNHSQRREAGTILADIGFSYAEDSGRYWLLFKYRALAPPVLTYLVDNYPSEPRTDLAYFTLGDLYERERRWESAIETHEDLILWRPDSSYAVSSQARIPHLRLLALASPEYDRYELNRARSELETWLDGYTGHPLQAEVERDLADSIQRLADSDLAIARFYRKVDKPSGAVYHARRALENARAVANQSQIEEAQDLLAALNAQPEESEPE